MSLNDQINKAVGELCVAIGQGKFEEAVGRLLMATMQEAYDRGRKTVEGPANPGGEPPPGITAIGNSFEVRGTLTEVFPRSLTATVEIGEKASVTIFLRSKQQAQKIALMNGGRVAFRGRVNTFGRFVTDDEGDD